MSINAAVLVEGFIESINKGVVPFLLERGESIKYKTSSHRNTLKIQSSTTNSRSINISAQDGYIYLTNLRIVFVVVSKGDIDSFQIMLSNTKSLQFSHKLVSPWFGANYWEFLFKSVNSNDGFPVNDWFKGTIMFNDGGIFNFVAELDVLLNDIINNSHIDEELPRYSET